MNKQIKKIAIVGPESTGKSTITAALANHFNTLWVPEYARYYCMNLKSNCTLQDEENMYFGQIALEASIMAIANKDFIFCDTTFLTVKIWSDEMLGQTPEVVLEALKNHSYDYYLLLDIDLPWEDDPLRDFPDKREYFMEVWHRELIALNANYTLVTGLGRDRLQNSIDAVKTYLQQNE